MIKHPFYLCIFNFIISFILLLFISQPPALAATQSSGKRLDPISSVLVYRTNQGYGETLTFTVKDGNLLLGSKIRSLTDALKELPVISMALQVQEGKPQTLELCHAGEYFHETLVHKKKRVEVGCLEDPRFQELNAAFARVNHL